MGFVNLAPFPAEQYLLADENGADLLVLVAKSSYRIEGRTELAPDEDPAPVRAVPEYFGEPDASSLHFASETDIFKPAADVVLVGHAHAPRGQAVKQLDVTLRVGGLAKTVRVFGDREWSEPRGVFRKTRKIGEPAPFRTMPLVYERAFGGSDTSPEKEEDHAREPRNHVGAGLIAANSTVDGPVALPNLEDPRDLIQSPADRPAPAGFGYVSPQWESRLRHAGTYDENWERTRMPLLPEDFDRRFYNAAHPDLIVDGYLEGGETVEVVNASPRGTLRFRLPRVRPEGVVMMKDGTRESIRMLLDTLIVDTDEHRAFLVWRGNLNVFARVHDMLWAKVQLASREAADHAA